MGDFRKIALDTVECPLSISAALRKTFYILCLLNCDF